MCHLLDKHISVVNALDTYLREFGGNIGGYAIAPRAAAEGRRVRY